MINYRRYGEPICASKERQRRHSKTITYVNTLDELAYVRGVKRPEPRGAENRGHPRDNQDEFLLSGASSPPQTIT